MSKLLQLVTILSNVGHADEIGTTWYFVPNMAWPSVLQIVAIKHLLLFSFQNIESAAHHWGAKECSITMHASKSGKDKLQQLHLIVADWFQAACKVSMNLLFSLFSVCIIKLPKCTFPSSAHILPGILVVCAKKYHFYLCHYITISTIWHRCLGVFV